MRLYLQTVVTIDQIYQAIARREQGRGGVLRTRAPRPPGALLGL
jgi:hypothetical protein